MPKSKQLPKYLPKEIESKWNKKWTEEGLYTFKPDPTKEKYYNLVELPYPSGDLHLGHWLAFVPPDVHARYKRMQGYNVFFPNGFDAFGLPAENAAIKRGLDPKEWSMSNIKTMRKQFGTMGTMIDWSHEAITCVPEYYKWNQWIFLRLLEKGLAYRGKALGNWCPVDKTVLANEHVESGKCWRCGAEVIQKEIEQWFVKLTAYADELIWKEPETKKSSEEDFSDLTGSPRPGRHTPGTAYNNKNNSVNTLKVDWPKSVREGQNKWIGRSQGVELEFKIQNSKFKIKVFTTALDTVYGVTFMVISPEHPLVEKITPSKYKKQVQQYVNKSAKKSELERMAEGKEKTGVFTGAYCINPFNQELVPIWVADYVIMNYGTGVVMGVPGHDERDHEFAMKFGLEIKPVIKPEGNSSKLFQIERDGFWNYSDIKGAKDKAVLFNSGEFNGLTSEEAKPKMESFIEKNGFGKKIVQYHLHDWSISRQRYWGTPIPVVNCKKDGIVPVPDDQLPVILPEHVDFTPKGKPPLATDSEWINTTCPKCGGPAQREAETMDTFFDSSWYFYRYVSPHYEKGPFDKLRVKELLPVDVYFGGAEHTLGHTLYARFFTKFFKNLGLIDFDEFAWKRVQHGVILGPDGSRMSKSRGNVVNPDDLVLEFGADTVRTYLCFMMPYEATAPWSSEGIWGCYRLLKRIWEMQEKCQISNIKYQMSNEDKVQMNRTIKKVGEDINNMKFNTAVAAIMSWMNYLESKDNISRTEYVNLILIVAPFAPHMAEELWQKIKASANDLVKSFGSVHQENWPKYEEKYLVEDTIEIVVQINGKMRGSIRVQRSAFSVQKNVEDQARDSGKVKGYLEGKEIKKVIYVPGKIVNFVI